MATDFSSNQDNTEPELNCNTTLSRYRYIITYKYASIVQKLQLQNGNHLSSTEREYRGLSYALHKAILIMYLLSKMKTYSFNINSATPTITCIIFEDNSSTLEMANAHKF